MQLNQTIHECIGYERREEGVARDPAETLRIGRGACRDVAVLLAEMLARRWDWRRDSLADICEKAMPKRAARRRFASRLDGSFSCPVPAGLAWMRPTAFFAITISFPRQWDLTPADITPISGAYFHRKRSSRAR